MDNNKKIVGNMKFKSSNLILNELNKSYYVTKRHVNGITLNDTYDVYLHPDNGELDFICSVISKSSRQKSVVFDNKSYGNVDELIGAVTTYNNTLMFPSKFYDPATIGSVNADRKIDWYLSKKLGMDRYDDLYHYQNNNYLLKNAYGEKIISVKYEMDYSSHNDDKNATSGTIYHIIDDNSFIDVSFSDAEDAVKKLNSLLATDAFLSLKPLIDLCDKFDTKFSNMDGATINKVTNVLGIESNSYKEKIIPILEKILSELKNNKVLT